ncbi:3-oxoacyl-[acyl-carrier-protein] synthase III C-terminal domain-containing protein [Pseudonocardia broussonetiae]|uniref:Ketoacyl-ACP synthase III n=1 Tax=Pseudonocardia broussonetiae TaxID=2736640 RepID=A0A6M6JIW3_9PSEU|nr:3-oxoacyl-[acyl-carrier-protein] synthase III C-terminal domain-containing protein [Pseudonocardia broussonetiae]QJY46847.1 ketoacyl-ACP synthase III [Pseudonocardia broussonetiae]
MQPFVINGHGRMVFPSNFLPELDFTLLDDLDQLGAVIHRDFEAKAPSGTEILRRIEAGDHYATRYDVLRDVALNLFWSNRFTMTMYEKRPTRWRDVPRRRDDVFLPVLTPWVDADRKVAAVRDVYASLPAAWEGDAEDRIFDVLFDVLRHRRFHAAELPAVKPTVAQALADPTSLTYRLTSYDPDHPVYDHRRILDCAEDVPELEALHRWAMVLHDQYPWDRAATTLAPVGDLRDDDYVVVLHPRNRDVLDFVRRVTRDGRPAARRRIADHPPARTRPPVRPYPPLRVRERFAVLPRIEALTVVRGEHLCTNDDLIRNSAYSWSPMSAQEIVDKTGIESRVYTERPLEDLALEAAQAALRHAGREPEEIGAVLFCTCTSTKLMPSTSTWLSGQLGMQQTHSSCDVVAACAGLPYGLAEATRLLQEVERPVLLVCGEKFSDKIGTGRPARMIFGDAAAAIVIAPAGPGEQTDVEVLQTYASGPVEEVNSIIWPNPDFDGNVTVLGPDVRALAGRYLQQMIDELRDQSDPDGRAPTLLESIDLVVPHQANKTMVLKLAAAAGLAADRLFFNIETVGNTSAASIPLALADAKARGALTGPMRIFAPGFGAGAVGGYAVLRVDPAVIAPERV